MADDDSNQQDNARSAPLKGILLIGAVIVLVALAFLYMNRAGMAPGAPESVPQAAEQAQSDANPFPETQSMNLPPADQMVDNSGDTHSPAPEANKAEGTVDDIDDSDADAADTAPVEKLDIAKALGKRSIGDPNAPVKLEEYFSLTCSHCAHFHNDTLPELKKYIDNGQLYIEFNEFPLNAPALRASMIARCLPEDKYYGYITLLFKTQEAWTSNPDYMTPLRQDAKLAGMSDEQFDACLENNELQQALGQKIKDATDKWKVESTPTFIVNGGKERISGAQPTYEFERVFRAVTDGKVAPLPEGQKTDTQAPETKTE